MGCRRSTGPTHGRRTTWWQCAQPPSRSPRDAALSSPRQAFHDAFQRGHQLSIAAHVLDAAEQAGLDRPAVEAAVRDPQIKQTLREATDAAHELGVFGVPTIAIGDELFWGDDRLEDAAAHLAGRASRARSGDRYMSGRLDHLGVHVAESRNLSSYAWPTRTAAERSRWRRRCRARSRRPDRCR